MTLRLVDVIVLFVYLTGIVAFGSWFVRKSRSRRQFMAAGGALPAWAVGLSIFGTYVSSNSFVGAPGQSFRGNWNFFVFGLSLFPAAWIATRWFVPFYRTKGYISAYEHLEERFGPWARVYAVVIFLLLHITRSGTIMFGVSLAMSVLTGWPIKTIIIVAGIAVTLYTVLGGIEAVIWTDVVQSLILIGGLVLVSLLLLFTIDGGPSQLFATAAAHHKFSWGSWSLTDYAHSTVWVVFLYGMGVNLTRFGIDQTFIQRYHAAKSEAAARWSVWSGGLLYVPISIVLFFIGTALFAYYEHDAEMKAALQHQVARQFAEEEGKVTAELAGVEAAARRDARMAELTADKAFPHFISTKLRGGIAGLLIAALFAAGMSSIDTSLNSCATIAHEDIYVRYVRRSPSEVQSMRFLHVMTAVFGAGGIGIAMLLVGTRNLLQTAWTLEGIFFGCTLGLFLLGICTRRVRSPGAAVGVAAGVLMIVWMALSAGKEPILPKELRCGFHANMIIAVGTLVMFLVGYAASWLIPKRKRVPAS